MRRVWPESEDLLADLTMSIPLTPGSEDTLRQSTALLTDTVSDHLTLPTGVRPRPRPVDCHDVLCVAGVLPHPAGPVHGQPVALPVAGAVGAGEAGDACHSVPSNPTSSKIRARSIRNQ